MIPAQQYTVFFINTRLYLLIIAFSKESSFVVPNRTIFNNCSFRCYSSYMYRGRRHTAAGIEGVVHFERATIGTMQLTVKFKLRTSPYF